MSWNQCPHLDEVRQSLHHGHWPEACDPDLRAHLQACSRCSEEVALASHFQSARTVAVEAAQTQPPALLWWRAQLRKRNAALERVERPLAAAQGFAFVILLLALAGGIASMWQRVPDHAQAGLWTPATLLADWGYAPLMIGLVVLAMLGGMVVYLTVERH